ncbi:hypothetical protein AVEN_128169-1 [Araneus ventricosus]|uniref:Uncharacterized protein n=1 Tax=Araneus ventricosus TaxID=182803 RepID=A0A4Y2A0U6_ARAVE|nr:hypothetical protein AVEN_128169-1 [Araneus ventricosus]
MNSYCQIQVAGSTSGDSSNQVLDSLPRRENRRSSRSQGNTSLKEKLQRQKMSRKLKKKDRRQASMTGRETHQKPTRLRCSKWRKRADYLSGAVGTFFHSSGN